MNGTSKIAINCSIGSPFHNLPGWKWDLHGYTFWNYLPNCYDPTYCDTEHPPIPTKWLVEYDIPDDWASFKLGDNRNITYRCSTEGIFDSN